MRSTLIAGLLLAAFTLRADAEPVTHPTQTEKPPSVHVTAVVKYCPVSMPKRPRRECQEHEITPADGSDVASVMACMGGGMQSRATFLFEGELWHTRGVRCVEHWGGGFGAHLAHRLNK